MELDKLDNGKLMRALETTGNYMTKIPDSTHEFLHVEIIKRRLTNGIKWFICVSTPKCPDTHSKKLDSATFGKVLQAAWDCWINKEEDDNEELETEQAQAPEQSSPQLPTPSVATTTPTTRAVSPPTASPQLKHDGDNDLLDFFQETISQEYLSKDNLFRPEVINRRGTLRAKLMAFGKSLAADSLIKHYEDFYQPTEPVKYTVKDIATLERCPCLNGKHNIPWSMHAMSEVATAMFNLAADAPEVLQLQKCGGSKGVGKRLVAITPSSDQKRLYYNARQWLDDIVDVATTDATPRYDIVKVLLRVLNNMEPLAFTHVAADLPESMYDKYKLDPELQQAMTCPANLKVRQLRIVKSHLAYSSVDVLQSESVMRRLQVDDFVRPIPIEFREG